MGPMFRHERPQKGRYRQFHQVGVEALGFAGPDVDAEHMIMGARLWRRLGIADVALEINTLGNGASRARYRTTLDRVSGSAMSTCWTKTRAAACTAIRYGCWIARIRRCAQ